MKKYLFGLLAAFVLAGPRPCAAYSWTDLRDELRDQTKLTILKSATPAYFFDVDKQEHRGGVQTSVFTYRFLSADAGWMHSNHSSNLKGAAILGGSVHFDQLIADALPLYKDVFTAFLPDTARAFFSKVTFGFFTGHDFDDSRFCYGAFSGIELKF